MIMEIKTRYEYRELRKTFMNNVWLSLILSSSDFKKADALYRKAEIR